MVSGIRAVFCLILQNTGPNNHPGPGAESLSAVDRTFFCPWLAVHLEWSFSVISTGVTAALSVFTFSPHVLIKHRRPNSVIAHYEWAVFSQSVILEKLAFHCQTDYFTSSSLCAASCHVRQFSPRAGS